MNFNWIAFGNCIVAAALLCAVAAICIYALRILGKKHSSFLVVFTAFSVVATINAQKVNNISTGFTGLTGLGGVNLGFLNSADSLETDHTATSQSIANRRDVSDTDIARGWKIESVVTNAVSFAMSEDAAFVGNWHIHGARTSFGNNRVDLGEWRFPIGTNEEAFSSFWYFVDGRIRPTPKDAAREICAVGVPMSAVPGESRLWTKELLDGLRILTWENFFLGGDTNAPINAQICLSPNGDFTVRSNDVLTVCRRIYPDDFDGDGLANEIDAAPKSYDGDYFGVASPLPEGANLTAYCWVDLCVTGTTDKATVRVSCDGTSDLGDHVIIAKPNQVFRVPLLKGPWYDIESTSPVSVVATSSERVEVDFQDWSDGRIMFVRNPVDLWFENNGNLCELKSSENVGAQMSDLTGGCCLADITLLGFRWCCDASCNCGRNEHELGATASWEGYSQRVYSWVWCKCVSQTQAGASADVSFANDVIIFENEYTNALHDVVSHSSTTNSLHIKVTGGVYGGLLEIELNDGGRLGTFGGDVLFAPMEVAAGEIMELEHFFKAYKSSEREGDIVAKIRFTEFMTGTVIEDEDSMTAVRVRISVQVEAPECKFRDRHKFGVCEKVGCRQYPSKPAFSWVATEGSITDDEPVLYDCFYRCPMYNSERTLKVVKGDVFYVFSIVTVEPSIIVARNVEVVSYGIQENSAGGIGMKCDLFVGPMDVSFSNIYVEEVPCLNGTHSGYFDSLYFKDAWSHTVANGAGNWLCVDVLNKCGRDVAAWTNSLYRVNDAGLFVDDENCSWRNGHIEWEVPYGWHTNDVVDCFSPLKKFAEDVRQRFLITSNGTVTIEKFGNSVMRMTNDWQYLNGVRVK